MPMQNFIYAAIFLAMVLLPCVLAPLLARGGEQAAAGRGARFAQPQEKEAGGRSKHGHPLPA